MVNTIIVVRSKTTEIKCMVAAIHKIVKVYHIYGLYKLNEIKFFFLILFIFSIFVPLDKKSNEMCDYHDWEHKYMCCLTINLLLNSCGHKWKNVSQTSFPVFYIKKVIGGRRRGNVIGFELKLNFTSLQNTRTYFFRYLFHEFTR